MPNQTPYGASTESKENTQPMARNTKPAGDKPAAKKAAPKKAAAEKAPAKTAAEGRKPRGWLAADVKRICDDFLSGKLKLGEGEGLTPHRVAKLVQTRNGSEEPPSTGAVSAVFKRWQEYGFAKFSKKPFGFTEYTAKGKEVGLDGMIAARSEKRKADRAKAKKSTAKAAA
jgi:hypothetical protein